jgi:flagellar hook-associated protein FlgK
MGVVGYTTGLKALLSTRLALDTIGNNVANASTPGYSRQRVALSSALPVSVRGLLVGTGVDALDVRRVVDELLQRRIADQRSIGGRLQARFDSLGEIETYFNEPTESGLGSLMDGYFAQLAALSATPDDPIPRVGVVQAGLEMTGQFREIEARLAGMGTDLTRGLEMRVDEANALADRIALLNVEINAIELGSSQANGLRDERDLAVEELAELIDVEVHESSTGAVRVIAGGAELVSADRSHHLAVSETGGGAVTLTVEGVAGSLDARGGRIGGLIEQIEEFVPRLRAELDELARTLILGVNRLHSTGIPGSGPFHALTGDHAVQDLDQDGKLDDELLSKAGLPFGVSSGTLHVSITDEASGAITVHEIQISASHTTVGDFVDALNAVPHLSAELDAVGRVRIAAGTGYAFDFSSRLDPNPDDAGTFGGGAATLGSAGQEPFDLADGDTLLVSVGGAAAPASITFQAAQFADIDAASAEEVAAAINAEPSTGAAGLVARAVDGQLFLQTAASGAPPSAAGVPVLTLDGGSAVGAFGWAGHVGLAIAGNTVAVEVAVSGAYTGSENGKLFFRPNGDGVVGTTPGLGVDVFDAAGQKLTTLAIGEGYVPGTELDVGNGVKLSFGAGTLSAANFQSFALETLADSDTSDVLVALGINSFLTGSGAADVGVREDIEDDPSLIAAGLSDAAGDNANLLKLMELQDVPLDALGGKSVGQYYGTMVGSLGLETSAVGAGLEASESLATSLELRREQVSGVNVDEELVDLMRFEQSYQAAVRFVSVVNEVQAELLQLI